MYLLASWHSGLLPGCLLIVVCVLSQRLRGFFSDQAVAVALLRRRRDVRTASPWPRCFIKRLERSDWLQGWMHY